MMGAFPKVEAVPKPAAVESRLQHLLDTIPALILVGQPDGSVDFINRHWLEFTGHELEELQGWGWRAALHPDDVGRFAEELRAALATGEPFESEARVRRADGQYRWFRIRNAPLRDERGNIIQWYVAGYDIEDQKQAEDHLRLVIDATPAMLHSARPDGYLEFFNQRWLDYLGLSLQDICGWRWTNAVHPDDVEELVSKWRSSLAAGEPLECEVRVRRADGVYRWQLHRKVPLRDAAGNIVKWFGSSIDIEERKQAEDALRRSQAYLTEAQSLSHTGSFVYNLGIGKTLYWSEELFRIFGLDPQRGIPDGDETRRLVHPDDFDRVSETCLKGFREKAHFSQDYRLLLDDGTVKHLHVIWHPVLDNHGEVVEYVGTAADVTERKQAEDSLRKALDEIKKLKDQLYKENIALRDEIDKSSMFEEIVGASPALQAVLARVAKVAPTDSTVFITGETGTGKELIARAIHKRSQRSSRAFVSVNCAVIPRDLIASELFGHEKGAFTGATERRLGRFELAEGGTLFLDEVGELPAGIQIALLRVLQEREFERVGGNKPIRADVRVIAATNRDLEAAIAAGDFRRDLFYRLNVFPIEIPPLRERREDIPLLVEYFINRYARKAGKRIRRANKKSLELFESYPWPGNVRELQNVIERSVIVCETENFSVDESWLSRQPLANESKCQRELPEILAAQEKEMIEAGLSQCGGRVFGPSGAAAKLGMPRSTLESKIRSLKIDKNRFKTASPPKSP
jgi:formate hydrogenlyase transcriptional activator